MAEAYIGIGSNINPKGNIKKCLELLEPEFPIKKVSSFYETKPYGYEKQSNFINLAVGIKTSISPLSLLKKLQEIEKKLGRERKIKNGPRTIDLDILLYGSKIVNEKRLTIPHKGLFERDFMLIPLLDLNSELANPLTKKKIKYLKKKMKYNYIIKKIKL